MSTRLAYDSHADLVSHSGQPVSPDVILPYAAPPQIGELASVGSTERVGQARNTVTGRLLFGVMIGVAAGACALALLWWVNRFVRIPWRHYIAGSVCLGAALAAYFVRRRRFVATFVGVDGVARFTRFEDQPPTAATQEILCFRDVAELRCTITDVLLNGEYGGYGFTFSWLDHTANVRFSIAGGINEESDSSPEFQKFLFASAAREGWNAIHTERTLEQLRRYGNASFRVFDSDCLSVGAGFLDCTFDGRTQRLALDDVETFALQHGVLHIKSRTVKWYRGSREGRISCSRISNLDQFIALLHDPGGFLDGAGADPGHMPAYFRY